MLSEIRDAQRFVLVTHENPDGDAIGSLVAMHGLLTALGKDSVMFMSIDDMPLPYEYRFFDLDGLAAVPPPDVDERTVIYLDCGNIDRNPLEAVKGDDTHIVNIDHHHDNTRFGNVNWVEPDASCTAEMIWCLCERPRRRADVDDRRRALRRPRHRHRPLHVREQRRRARTRWPRR